MTNPVMSVLPDEEEVLESNLLATVTTNFVIIRSLGVRSHTILSLAHVSAVRKIGTSYPGLLVIACGLFVLAAAALCSKQGSGAYIPIAILGVAFLRGYLMSRKTSVALMVGPHWIETGGASSKEAGAVLRAIELARGSRKPGSERSSVAS